MVWGGWRLVRPFAKFFETIRYRKSSGEIVGEGSTKESFEWRFYGRATSLFDIETSRTSTKIVVRGEKHLCPVGCWTKRISSPRDEADVNLRNRVTEKYLIINSYPPIFNSSPAAERAIVPSLAHFFFSNESTLPEHIFVHEADICEIRSRFL